MLSGSIQNAPSGTLEYLWYQSGGPDVSLSGRETTTASFTAPDVTEDTQLKFRFNVDTEQSNAYSDEITLTVLAPQPETVPPEPVPELQNNNPSFVTIHPLYWCQCHFYRNYRKILARN